MPPSRSGLLAFFLLTSLALAAALGVGPCLQGTQARSVPSTSCPSSAQGPEAGAGSGGLRLGCDTLDLGVLAPGERHERWVAWQSRSARDLRVLGTRSGCGCARWLGLPARFAAGARGRLGVCLDAPEVLGPLDARLRLVLDAAPPDDVVTLRVRAYVGDRLVVRPAAIDLGRRTAGASVPVRLEVHLPPGPARAIGTELVAWPGQARVVAAARHDQHGADVLLDSTLDGASGPREGLLTVRAPGAGAACVPLRVLLEDPPRTTGPSAVR